jgi:hypothetical protein
VVVTHETLERAAPEVPDGLTPDLRVHLPVEDITSEMASEEWTPTATQAVVEGQLTDPSSLVGTPFGSGILRRLHDEPFHLSPNRSYALAKLPAPTAMQSVAEEHDTEVKPS